MSKKTAARSARWVLILMLIAGFLYSGVATLREGRRVFQVPAMSGPSASIDAYVAPANLSSGEDLRRAVRCLGPTEEIVLLADGPPLSDRDHQQISYAAGYLLYPHKRIVITEADPMTRNVIRLSSVQRH